jgi:hypothetical protein
MFRKLLRSTIFLTFLKWLAPKAWRYIKRKYDTRHNQHGTK